MTANAERRTIRLETAESNGFNSLGLRPELLRAITEAGFQRPTDIQAAAIPPALAGKDLLASAMTGSGKTAAFLLPILDRFAASGPRPGTRALILTPTRELAAQIGDHLAALSRHVKVTGAVIHGGVGMGPQEQALRNGVDVIIATPGRLLDHMRSPYARLGSVETLVLDEADRMLDMGFLPDVRRILSHLPRERQTLLFSATMPAQIVGLSSEMMRAPVRVGVERKAAPAHGITQAFYPVPSTLKAKLLLELLRRDEIGNAIVFCRTKHRANRLALQLEKDGVTAARIHGNRSQAQRTKALEGFKDGQFRVLVATDIVARGIDVMALEHVVNFDVPAAPEDYIHRVGRTARADAVGEAYTLVSPEEESDVKDIEKALGKRIERRTVVGFDYAARAERLEEPGRMSRRPSAGSPRSRQSPARRGGTR